MEKGKRRNLYLDIALGEQLNGLQCGPILANQSGSTLHETFPVRDEGGNFDDVTENLVFQHATSL